MQEAEKCDRQLLHLQASVLAHKRETPMNFYPAVKLCKLSRQRCFTALDAVFQS